MAAALSCKSFAGSSAKLANKARKANSVRAPVVVRAQKENVEKPELVGTWARHGMCTSGACLIQQYGSPVCVLRRMPTSTAANATSCSCPGTHD